MYFGVWQVPKRSISSRVNQPYNSTTPPKRANDGPKQGWRLADQPTSTLKRGERKTRDKRRNIHFVTNSRVLISFLLSARARLHCMTCFVVLQTSRTGQYLTHTSNLDRKPESQKACDSILRLLRLLSLPLVCQDSTRYLWPRHTQHTQQTAHGPHLTHKHTHTNPQTR